MNNQVGFGRVGPTPTADKSQTNFRRFRQFRYPATTAMATAAAMTPPSQTRHATAIRWRFFENPPWKTVMAPPWPSFNNIVLIKAFH